MDTQIHFITFYYRLHFNLRNHIQLHKLEGLTYIHILIFNIYRNVSMDLFNEILLADMSICDVTMWHQYICAFVFYYEYIYVTSYIYIYLWGSYFGFTGLNSGFFGDDFVVTRPLWTDLWRCRIWALGMLLCAPIVGGMAGVSILTDLGHSGDATVSSRG